MTTTPPPPRDALDDKVNRLFAGKVVRKDLVRKVKVGANVPVFVLEYLLGKYCATDDVAASPAARWAWLDCGMLWPLTRWPTSRKCPGRLSVR